MIESKFKNLTFPVETSDESPVAMKLKKMWLKLPVCEEPAVQSTVDDTMGKIYIHYVDNKIITKKNNFLFRPSADTLEEERNSPCANFPNKVKGESLSQKQRHQMKHRELFLSRQVETLPATHIRGKCSVTLLNETESLLSYLNKDVSK